MHKLCPFCDEPLSDKQSQHFNEQLETLIEEADPDPCPDNPRGLKISSARFISFCQQHRHEWDAVTKAKKGGRIRDLKEELEAVLEEPLESTFFIQSRDSFGPGSSGSRIYRTFGKQGAAYYGEKGFVILVETLREMFPQDVTSIEKLKPLDWGAVIEEVLLPEAAIMLIQQDKPDVSSEQALQIHHESRVFGAVQHAVDD